MKLLQLCQQYFSMLGISPNKLKPAENFNIRNLMWIPLFVLYTISYAVFMSQEVNSFIEYMFSIYMICSVIGIGTALATIAFRTRKFGANIRTWECNIDESKHYILNESNSNDVSNLSTLLSTKKKGFQYPESKTIYMKTIHHVEKWSEFIYFVTVKVTPVFLVLPNTIVCYCRYFATDLGNDAFDLLNPMW